MFFIKVLQNPQQVHVNVFVNALLIINDTVVSLFSSLQTIFEDFFVELISEIKWSLKN